MPVPSKAAYKFMKLCEHDPSHARGTCPSVSVSREMTKGQSPKGLPARARKAKR